MGKNTHSSEKSLSFQVKIAHFTILSQNSKNEKKFSRNFQLMFDFFNGSKNTTKDKFPLPEKKGLLFVHVGE